MTLAKILKLVQALASVATLVLVILAFWQIDLVRKQATTSFEDGVTDHYRRIMESIPLTIWLGSELKTLNKDSQDRCRDAICRYIDLSNDQAFLHKNKRVLAKVWI